MFRVMIVDDMEIMRRQIKRLPLWGEATGFSIAAEAEDGLEALEKLQMQPVDLLITDIRMPGINGIELLREVQERHLSSCVVFLSEHSEFHLAKEAIQYGIFDYLVKPVNPEELKKLLEKVKKRIEEIKSAQFQIKNLEDKLIEKIDVYYPSSHVDSLTKYISEGDRRALDTLSSLVDDTYAALGQDVMKTAMVLQRAYGEVLSNVNVRHGWLEKFSDTKPLSELSLTKFRDVDSIRNRLAESIDSLISIINKFILPAKKSPLIKQICSYVIDNVETEISMAKISEALYLTKNHIGEIFKHETGMTVLEYITMVKMERAKKLLTLEALKSFELSHRLGYSNSEYFGKLFKKHTGLSPAEFRNTPKKQV